MNSYYLAKLVFKIEVQNNKDVQQFDEQFRIFTAPTPGLALSNAHLIGKKEESTFLNSNKNLVSWIFIGVSELTSLQTLSNGGLIFSQTHETYHPEGYLQMVQQKNNGLELFTSISL
ncbi:MAG: DUF4288 domain-containing protein [Bacteroidia bacterium]|nr:DUF4288 domain-containing protein [Bacteroidia bacterium]